jgi:hypothetical protein
MGRRWRTVLVAAAALAGLLFCGTARAQEYRFAVPKVQVELTIRPDASVLIHYRFDFVNQPGAHAIDVVDVGMPTKDYEIQSAAIDGQPLSSWKPSTYIEIGPEVHLDPRAIPPGGSGVFECTALMKDFVFEDRTNKERASLRFTPTWFGSKCVVGQTQLLLIVKFPKGVHPDDVVWHKGGPEFFRKGVLDPEGVAFVSWTADYSFTGPRMFGCSFPRGAMDRVVASTWWKDFMRWWEGSKQAQQVSGALLIALFAALFFLITRGTGCSVFAVCVAFFLFVMWKSPPGHLALWLLIPAMGLILWQFRHRFKPRYMPAIARVERGRVRRGLTAAESAVLLELPLERALNMVVTDLLRKGAVEVAKDEPLAVKPVGSRPSPNIVELPDGRRVGLEPYEVGFLDVLSEAPEEVGKKDFSVAIRRLVGLVRYKMEGFDPEATRDYYRSVSEHAWDRLNNETGADAKDQIADRHLNWLSVVDDYGDRMDDERERGWFYRPAWYYSRGYRGDADWLRGMQRSSAEAAGRVADVIVQPVKGIDLSGVDRFTRETLSEIADSISSGKGGGCVGGGCACACAGCACACACAGGGR